MSRNAMPFVEVEGLGGRSNDWMSKVDLVILQRISKWRSREIAEIQTEPGTTSWRYDPSLAHILTVLLIDDRSS